MALSRFGMAIATMMPMIATTIKSSISVKPLLVLFFMRISLLISDLLSRRVPQHTGPNRARSSRYSAKIMSPRRIFVGEVEELRPPFVGARRRRSPLRALGILHERPVHDDDVGIET